MRRKWRPSSAAQWMLCSACGIVHSRVPCLFSHLDCSTPANAKGKQVTPPTGMPLLVPQTLNSLQKLPFPVYTTFDRGPLGSGSVSFGRRYLKRAVFLVCSRSNMYNNTVLHAYRNEKFYVLNICRTNISM